MNTRIGTVSRPIVAGACLALLTMLFSFVLGVAFGAQEGAIKAHLDESGSAVLQTVYNGDLAAKEAVVKKSWVYLKRAHLHGGAIGAAALGAILMLILLCRHELTANLSALALGIGALVYSLFWLFAGFAAPGLGSTAVAKESLSFLAIPGAGLCVLGMLGIIYSILRSTFFGSVNEAGA